MNDKLSWKAQIIHYSSGFMHFILLATAAFLVEIIANTLKKFGASEFLYTNLVILEKILMFADMVFLVWWIYCTTIERIKEISK